MRVSKVINHWFIINRPIDPFADNVKEIYETTTCFIVIALCSDGVVREYLFNTLEEICHRYNIEPDWFQH